MTEETKECVNCTEPLALDVRVCPECNEEQPAKGLIYAVYVLLFLFVQGAIYRFIWPEVESPFHYGAYFFLSFIATIAVVLSYRKISSRSE